MKNLMSASDKETGIIRRKQENDLRQAEKRKAEVDALFARLYEDWTVGRITEYNFNMLSVKYQDKQIQLEELRAKLDKVKQTTADVGKWLALIRKYATPMELTAPLLNMLIEKIVVHEADKHEDGTREQKVEIYYRFIGKID